MSWLARSMIAAPLILACCSARPEPGDRRPGASDAQRELVPVLTVNVGDEAVRMVFEVTNESDAPVELEFPTAQRYDFRVRTPASETIWRWSRGRMFAQALGTETLEPGETLRYRAWWPIRSRSGRFIAEGELTASNREIVERREFTIP